MNDCDIRINIIRNACEDIKNLTMICSVDKLSRDISSSLSFWVPIFKEYRYQLPKIIPTAHSAWISSFEKEGLLQKSVNRLMEILEHPQVDDIDIDGIEVKISDEFGLVFYDYEISFMEVFANVAGIDYNKLSLMLNNYVKKKLTGFEPDGLTYSEISYHNNIYHIIISDGHFITETDVSRDVVKTIFYRVLSHGKIPNDNIFGNRVLLNK